MERVALAVRFLSLLLEKIGKKLGTKQVKR